MTTTVCTIITKLELGGAQEVALFAAAKLDRPRFRSVLIAGEPGLLDEKARALEGVAFHQVPSLARPIRPWRDLRALISLTVLLRRLQPAIVHTHSSKAGILGRWAAWLARVPIIVHTIHGYGITPNQPWWLRSLLIGVERLTGLITTQWITVSQADLDRGLHWGLFRRSHVIVIRPGIDVRAFQAPPLPAPERDRLRAAWGVGPEHMLVGTVAPLKPQKAPHDFVAVAVRVCAHVPSARFVWVGDGELRGSVEAHIRSAKLEDRVRIVGWRRDVPAVMHALDAFLLTSRWEGLARVLLEARAAGVPIIATRVGGAAEAVVEGRHGWLCEGGDIEGLTGRLRDVLKTRGAGAPSRDGGDLPDEFDIHEMARQYQQLYDKLLADLSKGRLTRKPADLVRRAQ